MTVDEWFHAYLLRFGTDTIESPATQHGELEFLSDMGRDLFPEDATGFHVHRAFNSIQIKWQEGGRF